MKCLENLSLVDDECLEELQKDIANLIASYLDITQICFDLLDEIVVQDLFTYQVEKLFKEFNEISKKEFDGESIFYQMPARVESLRELAGLISKFEDNEEESAETGLLLAKEYIDIIKELNIGYEKEENRKEVKEYWFYRDGTNGEAFLETRAGMFDYLKVTIQCFENKDNQILALRELKKFKELYCR